MLLSFLAKCHFGVLLTVLFGTAVSQPVGSNEWRVGQVPTHGQEESTLFGAEHGWHSVHPEAAFPNSPGAWGSGSVAPAALNSRWDGAQAVGSSQAPAVGSRAPAPAPFHPHVLESQGAQLHNGFASSSAAHPIDWFADNAHHAFGVRLTRMLAAREAFGSDRRQWETWSEHMRRAMGSRELQISPVNVRDYGDVAQCLQFNSFLSVEFARLGCLFAGLCAFRGPKRAELLCASCSSLAFGNLISAEDCCAAKVSMWTVEVVNVDACKPVPV
ncbi:hypothetical protein L1887_61842 [Cichorium endivia]|nr:hypothetical protein L1887_61842 [Cichorium endivia]